MSENKELFIPKQDRSAEISQLTTGKIESLDNKAELAVELSPRDLEARAEKARTEAMHNAISSEIKGKDTERVGKHSSPIRRSAISKKLREDSYKKTINQVQSELSATSRLFSKITHMKAIEKTSDIIGNTVARPNAMLSGAFFAFILTLIVYIIAKTTGYVLSGFETIASFIIGWSLGIVYDYLRVLITGKKS
jgi:hypothetical protein